MRKEQKDQEKKDRIYQSTRGRRIPKFEKVQEQAGWLCPKQEKNDSKRGTIWSYRQGRILGLRSGQLGELPFKLNKTKICP